MSELDAGSLILSNRRSQMTRHNSQLMLGRRYGS